MVLAGLRRRRRPCPATGRDRAGPLGLPAPGQAASSSSTCATDRGPRWWRAHGRPLDVLLEGNRPGAMERRGLGPDELLARNPRLVYTRLTGWGQDGPYAQRAGHDINYLAISGALGAIGTSEPVPPLALLGDLASGSLTAALGTVLALFERERTGRGQVVDAAIVDGAVLLLSAAFGERASGMWSGGRGTHVLVGRGAVLRRVRVRRRRVVRGRRHRAAVLRRHARGARRARRPGGAVGGRAVVGAASRAGRRLPHAGA